MHESLDIRTWLSTVTNIRDAKIIRMFDFLKGYLFSHIQ